MSVSNLHLEYPLLRHDIIHEMDTVYEETDVCDTIHPPHEMFRALGWNSMYPPLFLRCQISICVGHRTQPRYVF